MTNAEDLEAVKTFDDGSKIVKHPCGIEFRYDPTKDFGTATAGLDTWGARLEEFQFNNVLTLRDRIAKLEKFAEAPIRSERSGVVIDTHKEIYNETTGEYITVLTKEYNLLQNIELFSAFASVCDSTGLTPIGRIDVGEKGFTLGHATFMEPEFTITLLEQYPEPTAIGVELRNDFAGRMGAAGSVWGFVTNCKNFCQWGHLMGEFWVPHNSSDIKHVAEMTEDYVKNIASSSSILTKTCSDAESELIERDIIGDVLWGTNMPIKMIDAITVDPKAFNHRDLSGGMTKFQLYNCATNAITFKEGMSSKSAMNYSNGAIDLLTCDVDFLIKKGVKRHEAYNDFASRQNAKNKRLKEEAKKIASQTP